VNTALEGVVLTMKALGVDKVSRSPALHLGIRILSHRCLPGSPGAVAVLALGATQRAHCMGSGLAYVVLGCKHGTSIPPRLACLEAVARPHINGGRVCV